jgi:hypothetical protein
MPTLADPRPEDIALTLAYLAALLGVARATWREPVGPGRRGWLATGVVVAALAINQQTDAHAPALKAGARMLKTFGLSATSAPILVGSATLIATSGILAIAWLIGRFRKGLPPGTTAGAGLLLLGAHVLGRGARLLHVLQAPWADADLTNALKVVEGIGLLMILTPELDS